MPEPHVIEKDSAVNWLGDGWLDAGNVPIADKLTTRIYGGSDKHRKKWLKGLVTWDTNGPQLSVTASSNIPSCTTRWCTERRGCIPRHATSALF